MEEIKKYKNKYRVESARRKGWDYSQTGEYFVTICAKNKEMFFGDVVGEGEDAEMRLSEIGKIAEKYWLEIPQHFPFITLDEFIVMPNHIHGILIINPSDNVETQNLASDSKTQNLASLRGEYKNRFGPQSKNLSSVIRGFKIGVKKYATMNYINFLWQTRFYDRIIRNEKELSGARTYIVNNPLKWHLDKNNPENLFM